MPSLYQFSAWVFHVSRETVGGLWGPHARPAASTFFAYASLPLMTLYGKILKFGTFKLFPLPTPRLQNSASRSYSTRSSAAPFPRGNRRMMALLTVVSLIMAAGSVTPFSSSSSVILLLPRYASDSTTPLRMKLQNLCRNSQLGQAHSTVI